MNRRRSARGSESHELGEGGDEKKKRDSRKSGFLNLIKSRSKTERPPTVLMTDEPSSPKGAIRSPASDTPKKDAKPAEHNGSSERLEEMKTPDPVEESPGEDVGKADRSDSKGSPQAGRRYGVQVMGSGLLAEMKAKQERRAAWAQKVRTRSFRGGVSGVVPHSAFMGEGGAEPACPVAYRSQNKRLFPKEHRAPRHGRAPLGDRGRLS